MKLYVANCTRQDHLIGYRAPEIGTKQQMIPAGQQQSIGGDLNAHQIEAIKSQLLRYGLHSVADAERSRHVVPLIFSDDRPVPYKAILRAMHHNAGILNAQGKQRRQEAAVAASSVLEEQERTRFAPAPATLEMSVEEEHRGDFSESDPLAEGLRVVSGSEPPSPPLSRARRRAA